MSNPGRGRVKPVLFFVSSAILILSVSISMLAVMGVNPIGNYAFGQTSIVRTSELKVNFRNLVEAGSDQNIRVVVTDQATGDPISSAVVRITIYFPGGAPIRQFSLLTNEDGKVSLTLPIDENAALGQYGLDVLVSALGYFDSAVGTISWAVMSDVDQDVDLNDYEDTSHTID
jgi:5-hydroxyisourate hydrolase-like protein (transthyretin family)